jgi:hypothetical protein
MKTGTKKLTLNKEMLRVLESTAAREANGGNASISWNTCPISAGKRGEQLCSVYLSVYRGC